jgi:hypothetical protein
VFDKFKGFSDQLRDLVQLLVEWLGEHKAKIKSAQFAFRDGGGILFLVMQKERTFDQQLSDSLTDLDLAIATNKELDLIELDVLLIPPVSPEAASAFIASGESYKYAE